jgi:predicted secreted Zn-dependent protease
MPHRLRQNQKWSSYVIFKIVCCVLEVQESSLSKVMTFTLIPFCPEVTQQIQLLWTHFVHGLVTHESL